MYEIDKTTRRPKTCERESVVPADGFYDLAAIGSDGTTLIVFRLDRRVTAGERFPEGLHGMPRQDQGPPTWWVRRLL